MKKPILEIYALAVCFFTVACFVITLGIALYDLIQITNPEFTLSAYQYERYQSNEAFKQSLHLNKDEKVLSDEELTKRREEGHTQAIRAERHEAAQSLVQMSLIIFIDLIVFIIHWLLAKRVRQSSVV